MKFNKTNKSLNAAEKALKDRINSNFEEITKALTKVNNIKIDDIDKTKLASKIVTEFEQTYNETVNENSNKNEDVLSVRLNTKKIRVLAKDLFIKAIESYVSINNLSYNDEQFKIDLKLINIIRDIDSEFYNIKLDELMKNLKDLQNTNKNLNFLSHLSDEITIRLEMFRIERLADEYIDEVLDELLKSNNILYKMRDSNIYKQFDIAQI